MHSCRTHHPWLRRAAVLTFVAAICSVPSPGTADPISITRGSIGIWSDGGDYPDRIEPVTEMLFGFPMPSGPVEYMSGEALSTLHLTRRSFPNPLVGGVTVNLSTTLTWTNGGLTDTEIEGCCYENRMYRSYGSFSLVAGDALLQGTDQLVGYAPFSFTGLITAFDPATGAALFQRQLQGHGRATLYTYRSGYFEEHNSPRAAYGDFFVFIYDMQPVPEPGTLALLGGGLGLAALRARRRGAR